MRLLAVTSLVLLASVSHAKTSYDGYQVLRTSNLTYAAAAQLRELQMTTSSLDFWSLPHEGRPVDINIPPELVESMKEMFTNHGVETSVMIQD